MRLWAVVRGIGLPECSLLAIDLDRADKNEALYSCCDCLPGKVHGALHVDLAKCSKRVGLGIIHHMNTSCTMNHRIAAEQRFAPLTCFFKRIEGHRLYRGR
ncbi:hypothetical protein D3C80_1889100 [compost metagenome]